MKTEPKLRVLSLGAGVQSTAMALMAAHGEFEHMPDVAIFADTQSEPKSVYDHLNWLMSDNVLPFPVEIISKGNLGEHIREKAAKGEFLNVPFYTSNDRKGGGLMRRQCTREFKVTPLNKKMRELAGYKPRQRIPEHTVECWVGISTDEATRMKPSRERWIDNRWPLIEKRLSRADCLLWMGRNGYPLPAKSSCTFCPYRGDLAWRDMRTNDPDSWRDAVDMDERIRSSRPSGKNDELFVHSSLVPLSEVDLSTAEDRGQISMGMFDERFDNECEGMCGV